MGDGITSLVCRLAVNRSLALDCISSTPKRCHYVKMGSERNPEYKDVSNISNNHLPIRMPLCVDGFEEKSKVQRRLTHNKNQVPNIMQLCVDGFEEKSRLQGRLKFTKTHLHKMMRLRVDGFGKKKSTCVLATPISWFGDTKFRVLARPMCVS